ncbi:Uncharacterized protein DBV15_08010 [Temnothorax longispinosus]|uniref:DUF4817 domain-containing protein n=1 Tax=Temnothorax longispinosus TaxID=300112 RepID=A0A4S2L5S7_9HYME|nr:Uncharacterized protein DBV15_08010 [Temnothorax longispinosus]
MNIRIIVGQKYQVTMTYFAAVPRIYELCCKIKKYSSVSYYYILYTNEKLANMLLIYGECRKNGRQAAILYAERFPEERHPAHGYFHTLLTRLVQHGTLHASTRARNHHRRPEETINQVREAIVENPHTSTRSIGYDLPKICSVEKDFVIGSQNRREHFPRSDGMINCHNEHHYAVENPHCIKETHVQGRFHVNVWMGIVDDTIIGPYFFPENVNVTAEQHDSNSSNFESDDFIIDRSDKNIR